MDRRARMRLRSAVALRFASWAFRCAKVPGSVTTLALRSKAVTVSRRLLHVSIVVSRHMRFISVILLPGLGPGSSAA
jgi:hypothetical protein